VKDADQIGMRKLGSNLVFMFEELHLTALLCRRFEQRFDSDEFTLFIIVSTPKTA
jgi:hypothetical protein